MIRPALMEDMPEIERVYGAARRFMAQSGNPSQWGNSYPERVITEEDIEKKRLFVLEEAGNICGVFAFMEGPDPTYAAIYDGAWESDAPYYAMHRIASDGTTRGFLGTVLEFCRAKSCHLRVDTYKDNRVMQHVLEKNGFERRGIVYPDGKREFIAYEFIDTNSLK